MNAPQAKLNREQIIQLALSLDNPNTQQTVQALFNEDQECLLMDLKQVLEAQDKALYLSQEQMDIDLLDKWSRDKEQIIKEILRQFPSPVPS